MLGIQDRLTRRRHAETFAQPRDTTAARDDDDDIYVRIYPWDRKIGHATNHAIEMKRHSFKVQ